MVALVGKEAEVTAFVAEGELSATEVLGAYSEFLEGGISRLALWDFSRATLRRIDSEGIRDLARKVVQVNRGRRSAGKTAVVCGRLVDFGTARMLATHLSIEGYPVEVVVFMDKTAAMAWLAEEESDE